MAQRAITEHNNLYFFFFSKDSSFFYWKGRPKGRVTERDLDLLLNIPSCCSVIYRAETPTWKTLAENGLINVVNSASISSQISLVEWSYDFHLHQGVYKMNSMRFFSICARGNEICRITYPLSQVVLRKSCVSFSELFDPVLSST